MTDPVTILTGDALTILRTLENESVHCCVTSPPYWGLRDYGVEGQMGLEKTPQEYVGRMVKVFAEVKRVLRDDGTLWLNLGASYFSDGPKGSGGKKSFQTSNAGSFFDGKRPIQSRSGVPSYGSASKEFPSSDCSGRACPDCGGELTACSLNRCDRTERSDHVISQGEQQPLKIARDNGHQDCASTSPSVSCSYGPDSTNASLRENGQGAYDHEEITLEHPSKVPTSGAGVQSSLNKSACTSGTQTSDRPLNFHSLGKAFVCMACGYSTRMHPAYKPKDLVNIPFLVAEALRSDGWYLRSDIVWAKPNPMPESVTDRPTRSHEYIFLLAKSGRYFYDAAAIREPASPALIKQVEEGYNGHAIKDYLGMNVQDASATKSRIINGYRNRIDKQRGHSRRHAGFNEKWDALTPAEQGLLGSNKRSVWTHAPANFKAAHFATFPPDLIKPCILAGCPVGGTVLDPFAGSGTTGQVAMDFGRKAVLIELNPEYVKLIEQRCARTPGLPL